MARSRASTPVNGAESENSSNSEPVRAHLLCPSVKHHPGLTMPSPDRGDGNNDGGSPRKKFKYVKPRLGSYFQATVPSFVPPTAKSQADLSMSMSNHSMDLTQASTTSKRKKAGRPPKGSKSLQAESFEQLAYDPSIDTKRGGLCIHKPTNQKAQDEFLAFSRNIQLQTPKSTTHFTERADYLWQKALDENKYKVLKKVVVEKKKRGRKRKLVEKEDSSISEISAITGNSVDEESMDVSTHDCEADVNHEEETNKDIAIGLEEDDQMLEFLHRTGDDHNDRAKFLAMVTLCRGTAVRTRRRFRKAKKKEEMNEGSTPLAALIAPMSYTWQRRLENYQSLVLGDHRKNAGQTDYQYFTEENSSMSTIFPWNRRWEGLDSKESTNEDCQIKRSGPINADWDSYEKIERDETLMASWTSILEKGQIIIENEANGNKPVLTDMITLLKKAQTIPHPEEVFGKRDSMPKRISQCLNAILDLVEHGREILAHITDLFFDSSDDGLELKSLRKTFDSKIEILKVQLLETDVARDVLYEAMAWESKLADVTENGDGDDSVSSEDLHLPTQSLTSAENMAEEGRALSIRPSSLVLLEERIHKAYELRNRIRAWSKNDNGKENPKFVGSTIKEANKINLSFPELSLLSKVHRDAEEWMDRANVALRSKISLSELESLITSGEKMPLGLTTQLEKLKNRFDQACAWIASLKEEVPCPMESTNCSGSDLDAGNKAEWLLNMRNALNSDDDQVVSNLLDLSSQGSRLPVDIDILHLLQTAIDARNWSQKAKRWIPSAGENYKRGKFDDLEDHLESSTTIMKRAKQLTDGKADWKLDFSDDLENIVISAEKWFEKHRPLLTGDNRRSNSRNRCSYSKLKEIVDEADKIPCNLGNPYTKISRIHNEAMKWMEENDNLLKRCGIVGNLPEPTSKQKPVSIEEVSAAVESAKNDLSVDLEEAKGLEEMALKSQSWFDQVADVAPVKRSKRVVGKKNDSTKASVQTVLLLIDKATDIPMDTTESVERLNILLHEVQAWRLETQQSLKNLNTLVKQVSSSRKEHHHSKSQNSTMGDMDIDVKSPESMKVDDEKKEPSELSDSSMSEETKDDIFRNFENISNTLSLVSILTFEEDLIKKLSSFMKWWKKACDVVDSHEQIFSDKKWKKDLGVLVQQGPKMQKMIDKSSFNLSDSEIEEMKLLEETQYGITCITKEEISRLEILRVKCDEYYKWCEKVTESYIECDKRVPLEVLTNLAKECEIYPSNAETVKRVMRDARVATEWIEDASKILQSKQATTLAEVKSKLNKVAKVKFTSPEYVDLKKAHQTAKTWVNRVNKSVVDDGSVQIHELKQLLREHKDLLIAFPEEEAKLKQALCGYCICRRPYEGFMIGCDECEEWYHGPCIGMTQAQGDKLEKYVCIRCCIKKVYKLSCNKVAFVARKWCDKKDLSKARSQDNQKHQRKIREKKKEIEKWRNECQSSIEVLQKVKEKKRARQIAIETARLQAVAAEDELTLGVPSIPTINFAQDESLDREEALATANLTKSTAALEEANQRMMELTEYTKERKLIQRTEDSIASTFRYWAAMIRTLILAPDDNEVAIKAMPNVSIACISPDQLLSDPMKYVLDATVELGLDTFPDVKVVRRAFESLGWACIALDVLKKKPTIGELQHLQELTNTVTLPEVKSIKMIKDLISRTSSWRAKVRKALAPVHGETSPFDMNELKALGMCLSAIPMKTPEQKLLYNVFCDEGTRHCVCGGPRDEENMITCNSCGNWFHESCRESGIQGGKCDRCEKGDASTVVKSNTNPISPDLICPFVVLDEEEDISPHAPTVHTLWPPFGLSNSPEAHAGLGIAVSFKLEHMAKPAKKQIEVHIPTSNFPLNATQTPNQQHLSTSTISQTIPGALALPTSSTFQSALSSSYAHKEESKTTVPAQLQSVNSNKQTSSLLNSRFSSPEKSMQITENAQEISHLKTTESMDTNSPNLVGIQPDSSKIFEGLPDSVVADALFVAKSVAESIPFAENSDNCLPLTSSPHAQESVTHAVSTLAPKVEVGTVTDTCTLDLNVKPTESPDQETKTYGNGVHKSSLTEAVSKEVTASSNQNSIASYNNLTDGIKASVSIGITDLNKTTPATHFPQDSEQRNKSE